MKKTLSRAALLALILGPFHGHATSPVRAEDGERDRGGALYVVTHVDVMPKFTEPGRELLRRFADDSRKDPGAVRVEVVEELSRPNHSTVLEVWESREAYEAHLGAEHTRAYRAKLQPMLGSPFDERLHHLSR